MRLCGTIKEQHLLCCDVHNLNRESVESEGRFWERGGGGCESERSSEENRVRAGERGGDRFLWCVCVYGVHKSKRGNGSVESAFYSPQLLTWLRDLKH